MLYEEAAFINELKFLTSTSASLSGKAFPNPKIVRDISSLYKERSIMSQFDEIFVLTFSFPGEELGLAKTPKNLEGARKP